MFMDGIIYASIAENLSNDIGSFWDMKFTETSGEFNGHPPLAMYLESISFKILGNYFWVEKIHSLLMVLLTLMMSVLVFKKLNSKNDSSSFLVLLFSLTMPLFYWVTTNNLLENTMAVFTTLAIYLFINYDKRFLLFSFLAGIVIYLAFLTKGVVALFPFAVPFWLMMFKFINLKQFIFSSIISVLGFAIIAFGFHFVQPESTEFFKVYFQQQIVGSLESVSTVNSRFQIIIDYIAETAIGLTVVGLLAIFSKSKIDASLKNKFWLLIAISLSGVFPMMISMKQSAFYIFPALMISVVAIALLANYYAESWLKSLHQLKFIKPLSLVILVLSIASSLYFKDTIQRDKELIEDVEKISALTPDKNYINIHYSINTDYYAHCYFYRYYKKSLAVDAGDKIKMIRTENSDGINIIYKGNIYTLIEQ